MFSVSKSGTCSSGNCQLPTGGDEQFSFPESESTSEAPSSPTINLRSSTTDRGGHGDGCAADPRSPTTSREGSRGTKPSSSPSSKTQPGMFKRLQGALQSTFTKMSPKVWSGVNAFLSGVFRNRNFYII